MVASLAGLFEPAGVGDDVVAAIVVQVAYAEAVGVFFLVGFFGDGVEGPGFEGLLPVEGDETEITFVGADEDGGFVAEEVGELGGFVSDGIKDLVFWPGGFGFAGVFEDEGGGAGEADDKEIGEAVVVEIVGPGEEVVGVEIGGLGLGGIDFVSFFEGGAFVPVWAVDEIEVAVAIDVRRRLRLRSSRCW